MTAGSKIRFETAADVFGAFPNLEDEVSASPLPQPPLDYLKTLAESTTPEDAITFAAYMLPRRETVWWSVQCVRALAPPQTESEDRAIKMAEVWVREPEEHRRKAAMDIGMKLDKNQPSTWVALAAAWAGGNMMAGDHQGPPSPMQLTPQAARIAILIALSRGASADRQAAIKLCIDGANKLAG
jgi:hypothetical protein